MNNYINEQITNRKKIIFLAKIDLIKTYRSATLGWFGAIFKPAFAIFVYYFTFIIGLKVSKNIFGYPYSYEGWQYTSRADVPGIPWGYDEDGNYGPHTDMSIFYY